ncbi:hypothetical protein KAJ27_06755 [bacterium]|nr:hypothetical protein [bacterium]
MVSLFLLKITTRTGSISGIVKVGGYRDHSKIRVRISTLSNDENYFNIDYVQDDGGNFIESYTEQDGKFIITDVPSGNYWVCIEKKNFDIKLKLITVNTDGKNIDIGKITLK